MKLSTDRILTTHAGSMLDGKVIGRIDPARADRIVAEINR